MDEGVQIGAGCGQRQFHREFPGTNQERGKKKCGGILIRF